MKIYWIDYSSGIFSNKYQWCHFYYIVLFSSKVILSHSYIIFYTTVIGQTLFLPVILGKYLSIFRNL